MDSLNLVLTSVERGLATQRVGQPVAGRLIVHTLEQADDIPTLLARLISTASRWLGGSVAHLCAQGHVGDGQITVLARLDGGQSLLVSAGIRGQATPVVEAMVFGNHGIVSCGGPQGTGLTTIEPTRWTMSDEERRLAQLVRQSQQTRQAIGVGISAASSADPLRFPTGSFSIQRREQRAALSPPYGVLLVAGDHTHQPGYAEALVADNRCRLIGMADEADAPLRRRELNRRLAERLGTRVLPLLSEALTRPDVQVVSICAEPERRARIIRQAAQAGKHLYLDKPLCATVAEATEIVTAVREANVLGQMFSQVLWEPAAAVRALLESGQLGEIRAVHCDLTFAKGHAGGAVLGHSRPESPQPDRYELPDAKRELTNIGVYCVVLLLWLLRRPIRRVFAATENYFFAEHQSRNMEDFGQLLLELEGGVTASVTAARSGWRSHPSGGVNRVCLVGARGAVTVDAYRTRAELWSDAPPWLPPDRDPDDPMAMWAPLPDSRFKAAPKLDWLVPQTSTWSVDTGHFLDNLERGRDSDITVEIAAAATQTLLAAYLSAARRQIVVLD